jgi:hypothetical protein
VKPVKQTQNPKAEQKTKPYGKQKHVSVLHGRSVNYGEQREPNTQPGAAKAAQGKKQSWAVRKKGVS